MGEELELIASQVLVLVLGVGEDEVDETFGGDVVVDDAGPAAFAAACQRTVNLAETVAGGNQVAGSRIGEQGQLELEHLLFGEEPGRGALERWQTNEFHGAQVRQGRIVRKCCFFWRRTVCRRENGACGVWGGHYGRRRPMKAKWIIWAERGLLLTVVLAISMLTFLNVRDYRRYKFITELERHVTPEQFVAMAKRCDVKDRGDCGRYKGTLIPEEFAVLKPLDVALSRGTCDVKLYERGIAYAYLRIDTSPRNQRAHVFYDFDGGQKGHEVWLRDPEAEEPFRPKGRILTVNAWGMDEGRQIVITDAGLLVIAQSCVVGGQDEIVLKRALNADELQRIRAAVAHIPQNDRGKMYMTGVCDGLTMHLVFTDDGTPSREDITLDNAWCDSVAEVTELISSLLPGALRLPGRQDLFRPEWEGARIHVYTNAEWAARSIIPYGGYPWWLIWPRLVLGVKG